MSLRQLFHSSRSLRFATIHALLSIVVGIWIVKNLTPDTGTVFPRYFITFVEAFFGSLGFSFLSLVLLVKSFFLGYGNTGALNAGGHPIPMPVASGAAAFLAFLFLWVSRRVHSRMVMSVIFVLSSALFFASSYLYLHMPNVTDHLVGL